MHTLYHFLCCFVSFVRPALGRRVQRWALVAFAAVCLPTAGADEAGSASSATKEDLSVSMRAGGSGRYVLGRWGMVRGNLTNRTDQVETSLVVVTPAGSGGLQFARKVELPPKVAFDSQWPVFVSDVEAQGAVDFKYLFYPDGKDDGVIRHTGNDTEIPSFSGVTQRNGLALCGMIGESESPPKDESLVHQLLAVMRFASTGSPSVAYLVGANLTSNSECLEAFDQIAVTDSHLLRYPAACEAVRLWVLRGGKLHIVLDRAGEKVAEGLLGDSFPLTVVGQTTTNKLTLNLNPDYPTNQYPTRSVTREFDEPVRYLRVLPGTGEVIWTIDGWPVAMRTPLGQGTVLITAVSVEVFSEPSERTSPESPDRTMIASSRRFMDSLFTAKSPPLLSGTTVGSAAATAIGYEIPSRKVAALLLTIFPISLLIAGVLLQKRSMGQRMIFVIPALAILAAIPAAAVGFQIRSVAPATIIETAIVQSSAGFTELPSDGFATSFVPSPMNLEVSSERGARLDLLTDPTNSDYRRLTWSGPQDVAWMNLQQPAGLRTYPLKSTRVLKSPWRALATLDEKGLKGVLQAGDDLNPTDAFLAGVNHENLAVRMSPDRSFETTGSDVLAFGQFFKSTLLSDEQVLRGKILHSVFAEPPTERTESFPAQPSLVFWDESDSSTIELGNSGVRRQRSVLIVQPLELIPPEAGKSISIPPQLLSFRSIALPNGGMSSAYNNMRRQWLSQESSATTLLEFQIPSACLPFVVESAEVEMVVRAGSRVVSVLCGSLPNLQSAAELKSPLGTQTISLPTDLVQESCLTGKLLLQLNVSDIDESIKGDSLSGEQDDSWRIEKVLLSLKGHREP